MTNDNSILERVKRYKEGTSISYFEKLQKLNTCLIDEQIAIMALICLNKSKQTGYELSSDDLKLFIEYSEKVQSLMGSGQIRSRQVFCLIAVQVWG